MINKIKSELMFHYKDKQDVTAVAFIQGEFPLSPSIDGFDALVLVVTTLPDLNDNLIHYIKDGCYIQELQTSVRKLKSSIYDGHNRKVMQWLQKAECLLDREGHFESIQRQSGFLPEFIREKERFAEFSFFLRSYLQSKEQLELNDVMDAYHSILNALRYWARIEVINQGRWPETMVWNQVKKIDTEVYKLYEELTTSRESLRKRVELVQLACEFSMLSKMEDNCALLLRVLSNRKQYYSIAELQAELNDERIVNELPLIIKKMVKRGLIYPAHKNVSGSRNGIQEIKYGLLSK